MGLPAGRVSTQIRATKITTRGQGDKLEDRVTSFKIPPNDRRPNLDLFPEQSLVALLFAVVNTKPASCRET